MGHEILLTDPGSGQVHFLNPTAAEVWSCCDGSTTRASCEERLRRRFAVPATTDLGTDIAAVLRDLGARGLLQAPDEDTA